MLENVYAQAVDNAAQSPSMIQSFLPFILIFLVFYFLVIRPQKKKMEQEQAFVNSLGKGQEVYLKSGLIGTIEGITDKVVTLQVDQGTKIKVLRSQVAGLAQKILNPTVEEKKKS